MYMKNTLNFGQK